MPPSFDQQLENCLPDLWRYAWSLTRDRHAADDLVQDCVERALRKRRFWLPGRPLKPWLAKVLLNIFRDQWRRDGRYRQVALDEIGHFPTTISSAEDRLEVKDVWACIDGLPPDQSEALLAVVVAGLSYDEAARALMIPKGTLMSRISRARAKIRTGMNRSDTVRIRSVK